MLGCKQALYKDFCPNDSLHWFKTGFQPFFFQSLKSHVEYPLENSTDSHSKAISKQGSGD